MANPSVTYTFSNSTTADASQVNQNFTDIINGITDGSKDLSINAITAAGNATFNGNTAIGNASSDTLSITASLATGIPIGTNTSYDIGSSTLGLRGLYFGGTSTFTGEILAPTLAASRVYTLPLITGNLALAGMTVQRFTSGSGTYTTPTGCRAIVVEMIGGAGGASSSGTALPQAGADGGDTTFGSMTAPKGSGAATANTANYGGAGGGTPTTTGATYVLKAHAGAAGGSNTQYYNPGVSAQPGGMGGVSPFGGAGAGATASAAGGAAQTNTGSGGGGASTGIGAAGFAGGGGGAGAYIVAVYVAPAATYSYGVGGGGAGGTAGTNGFAGGAGAAGQIIVTELY